MTEQFVEVSSSSYFSLVCFDLTTTETASVTHSLQASADMDTRDIIVNTDGTGVFDRGSDDSMLRRVWKGILPFVQALCGQPCTCQRALPRGAATSLPHLCTHGQNRGLHGGWRCYRKRITVKVRHPIKDQRQTIASNSRLEGSGTWLGSRFFAAHLETFGKNCIPQ